MSTNAGMQTGRFEDAEASETPFWGLPGTRMSASGHNPSARGQAWARTRLCYSAAVDPPVPEIFDRPLRRRRRDRAATDLHDAFYLHRRAAEELIGRLDLVKREWNDVLLLGAHDPSLAETFRARGMSVVAADPGRRFAAAAGGVQTDEDRLPFADSSFDLVFSVGLLDSVDDLPGALLLIRRTLRPDGLLLAAFAGAGSLPRLRSALRAAEAAEGLPAAPRLHPQLDVRAAGDLLGRAGFVLSVADCETVAVRFAAFTDLIADLRAMGATNLLAARSTRPFGKKGLAAAMTDFAAAADADGRTTERMDIVYLSAWSPPVGGFGAPGGPTPRAFG